MRLHTLVLFASACSSSSAATTPPPAPTPVPQAAPTEDDPLVVHEWGTFTSVAGSDGVVLDWRPLAGPDDLPGFVHRLGERTLVGGSFKDVVTATQRMETPVIYFYTRRPREVSVEVGFPEGLVTEWYPRALSVSPDLAPGMTLDEPQVRGGTIRWGRVGLAPPTAERLALLPAADESHYAHARIADAALVRACATPGSDAGAELEGFLFYRGIGRFATPLAARATGDSLALENGGTAPIAAAFLVEVAGGRAAFTPIEAVAAGEHRRVARPALDRPIADVLPELAAAMESALRAEGLRPDEARAMVATWRDSWLSSDGVRVLYALPRAVTDAVLPLRIEPAPDELVRVLLGRLEVLTPEVERDARALVRRVGPARAREVLEARHGRLTDAILDAL